MAESLGSGKGLARPARLIKLRRAEQAEKGLREGAMSMGWGDKGRRVLERLLQDADAC